MGSGNDSNSCDSLLQDPEETDKLFTDYYIDDSSSRSASSVQASTSQDDIFDDCNSRDEKEKLTKVIKKINLQFLPTIPAVAVQEKIILCIDNTRDKGLSYSYMDMEKKVSESSPYCVRNEALSVFITNKLSIAKDTEFAIASVEPGKVEWLSIMSSDAQHLTNALSGLTSECEETTDFDVTPIFSNVLSLLSLPEQNSFKVIPPSYIIRIIFIYGNSYTEPKVNALDASYLKFMMSPCCVLDILYLHEKQSDFNNVEPIFQTLGKIISPSSYLLESSRNVTNVFKNTAKLLAHPYQRVNQHFCNL